MSNLTFRARSGNAQNQFVSALDIEPVDDHPEPPYAAPASALTWRTKAERNKLLNVWRRAVFAAFTMQPRALRLAAVLKDLFHDSMGYAFARNSHLAANAVLDERDMQRTLAALEKRGAIVRATVGKRRVVYPGMGVMEHAKRHGYRDPSLTTGTGTHGYRDPSIILINKKGTKPPLTEHERARLAATVREGKASGHATEVVAELCAPKGRAPPTPPTPPVAEAKMKAREAMAARRPTKNRTRESRTETRNFPVRETRPTVAGASMGDVQRTSVSSPAAQPVQPGPCRRAAARR